tara:strand:+ start:725 stop:1048 length:324 start_codon:yes stop_codon:yes gene_type:complete
MSNIIDLNKENFDKIIKDTKYPVIVDFWAEWCGPCKMIAPILEEISNEANGNLIVTKVNLDNNQELATKFSIRSIPTLLLFKDGLLKDTKVGLSSKTDLLEWVEKNN